MYFLLPGADKWREAPSARVRRATSCNVGHCLYMGLDMDVHDLPLHRVNSRLFSGEHTFDTYGAG